MLSRRQGVLFGVVAGIVIVAVVIALIVVASSHTASPSAHTSTTHAARGSSATTAPTNYVAIATSINLQPKDLDGYAFTKSTAGQVVDATGAATECAPVTGPAWLANVSSGLYTDNSNSVLALVEVLPTAADAQAGLASVTAPSVGASCIHPQGDTFVNAILAKVNQTASCPMTLTSSTVTPLTAATAWTGATGFRYVATLTCSGHTSGVTTDFVDETVGNVFIEGRFILFGGPQPGLEQNVMNAMAGRAQAYAASH